MATLLKYLTLLLFFFASVSQAQNTSKRDESNVFVNTGITKFSQNDYNGAIFDFTKAINTDPENAIAFYNRGMSKYHIKDFYGAQSDCNTAIKLNSKDANSYNVRGLVNQALGLVKEAMKDYDNAVKLSPTSYWGYFNRGLLYDLQNDYKNALKDYTKSIELNIVHVQSYQNRGIIYFKQKQYPEALTDLSQAIYMSPNNPNLFLNRGTIRGEMKDYANAIKDFEEVVKLDPRNNLAYFNLGVSYNNVKDREKACWAFDKALKLGHTAAKDAMLMYDCEGKNTSKVKVDPTIELKNNLLEKVNVTEDEIKQYLVSNEKYLDPIEGIWSANSAVVKDQKDKIENPNFARVAVVRDTATYQRDFKMIFLEGKDYFPGTVIAEFTNTSYQTMYISQVYSLDGLKEPWSFIIDEVGILTGSKNFVQGDKQIFKELYFIKLFPKKSAQAELKSKPDVSKEPSTGSGFVISKSGMIATNAHLINGHKEFFVEFITKENKKSFKVKILFKDEPNDVAILKVDDPSFLPFASLPYGIEEKHSVGESVFALGFPLAHLMGTELKVTNGIISSKTGAKDDIRYMQISVPLQPGNSGGPLFNNVGNIIGIASARLTGETQNVSYALKILYLNNLIKMSDDFQNDFKKDNLKGQPLEKQIDALKYYVCLITAK